MVSSFLQLIVSSGFEAGSYYGGLWNLYSIITALKGKKGGSVSGSRSGNGIFWEQVGVTISWARRSRK